MSLDLLCVADTSGHFVRLNPAVRTILGYEPSELEGQPFLQLIHPEDVASTRAEIQRLAESDVPAIRFENRYRCRDGSYRWLSWMSAPARDGLIYALARDVTHDKRLEFERRNHATRLHGLYDLLARQDVGTVSRIDQLLQMARDVTGCGLALIGRREGDDYVVEHAHSEYPELRAGHRLPLVETYCAEVFAGGEPVIAEDTRTTPLAGSLAHHTLRLRRYFGYPIHEGRGFERTLAICDADPGPRPSSSDFQFLDLLVQSIGTVIERAQIERTLERRRRELDTIIHSIPDALLYCDADRRIQLVNPAFCRMFGYDAQDVTGRSQALLFANYTEFLNYRDGQRDLDRTRPNVVSRNCRRSDGTEFPVAVVSAVMHVGSESEVGEVTVIRDISEQESSRRALQVKADELLESNRELERFAYAASHDLKAPVRAIGQLVEWIAEDQEGLGPRALEHVERIRQRVHRMENLLESLLAYSRANRCEPVFERFDLGEVVADVISVFSVQCDHQFEVVGALPVLRTQLVSVEQILTNLIGNCVRHHDRSDGRICVSAKEGAAAWELVIEDDGPGIAPELREKVFGLFQTVRRRDEFDSSGVGLAIVRRVAQSLGCQVRFADPETLRGCRAVVTIPKALSVSGEASRPESAEELRRAA